MKQNKKKVQRPTIESVQLPMSPGWPQRMRTEQAAQFLGVAPQTLVLWRCTKQVRIPYYKVGGRVTYDRNDLIAFLQTSKRDAVEAVTG